MDTEVTMGKALLTGLVAGAAVVGGVGGVSLASGGAGDDATVMRTERSSAVSPAAGSGGATSAGNASRFIDVQRAVEAALAATNGGHVTDVEAETEHGRPVWDVDVVKAGREFDVDVDAETGVVLRVRPDDRDGRHGDDRGRHHGHDDDSHSVRAGGDDRHWDDDIAGDRHGGRVGDDDDGAGDRHGGRVGDDDRDDDDRDDDERWDD